MKTAFLTGATGFIGTRLALKLADMNFRVNALVRTPAKAFVLNHDNINLIEGDLNSIDALTAGMEGCDVVFHMAALASMTSKRNNDFYDINVKGTQNIINAAKNAGVKRIVFTSTAGVIGPSVDKAINEDCIRTVDFFSEYEITKHKAEELVKLEVLNGMDIVTVCPPRVYGPGFISESNAVTKMISKYLEGKWRIIPGSGDRIGNYVFVEDVVNGHIKAWENGRSGEKYILGGSNVTFKEFFDTLGKVCNKKYSLYAIPAPIVVNTARVIEWGYNAVGAKPIITHKYADRFLNYHFELSSDKAKKELGYTYTPLEEGFRKTVKWLREQKKPTNTSNPYVLITGASSGIGKAMAIQCAHLGFNLILVALPKQGLVEFGKSIESYNNIDVRTFECDLTDKNSPELLYNWCLLNELKINMLINNAGMGHVGAFEESNPDQLLRLMNLNMQSLAMLTRLFLPELKKNRKAYILNVGSIASFNPVPFKSIYAATKAFVLSFSRSLREEVRLYNINVSCLCPGPTITSQEVIQRIEQAGWQARMLTLTADEVATIALNGLFKNQAVIIPDWKNSYLKKFSQILPVSIRMKILGYVFRKEQNKIKPIKGTPIEIPFPQEEMQKEEEKMVV